MIDGNYLKIKAFLSLITAFFMITLNVLEIAVLSWRSYLILKQNNKSNSNNSNVKF